MLRTTAGLIGRDDGEDEGAQLVEVAFKTATRLQLCKFNAAIATLNDAAKGLIAGFSLSFHVVTGTRGSHRVLGLSQCKGCGGTFSTSKYILPTESCAAQEDQGTMIVAAKGLRDFRRPHGSRCHTRLKVYAS